MAIHYWHVDDLMAKTLSEKYNEYQITYTLLSKMMNNSPRKLEPLTTNFIMRQIPNELNGTNELPCLRCYKLSGKLLLLCGYNVKNGKWFYYNQYTREWTFSKSFSNKIRKRYDTTYKCEEKLVNIIKGVNQLRIAFPELLCEDVKRLILSIVLRMISNDIK